MLQRVIQVERCRACKLLAGICHAVSMLTASFKITPQLLSEDNLLLVQECALLSSLYPDNPKDLQVTEHRLGFKISSDQL